MPVTVPSFDALWDAFKAEVQSRDADLTDWLPGSALDALAGASAVLTDEMVRAVIDAFAAHFVDTAEGDDLRALALDRFSIASSTFEAAAARLTVRFTTALGVYVAIPQGTSCKGTVDGEQVEFTTDAAAGIQAADSYVDVDCTCVVTGTAGNIAASVLDTVNDGAGVPGDPAITISHSERAVGGREDYTDEQIRAYLRSYFGTLRKGTVAAVEFGAKQVPGVFFATADESNIAPGDGGYTLVYVGDVDGRSNAAMETAVGTELLDWRACGCLHTVDGMVREEITLSLIVYVPSALTEREVLRSSIKEALLGYTDSLAAGKSLFGDKVHHAVNDVDSNIDHVTVTGSGGPFAEITVSSPENCLRVTESGLTITFQDA